MTKVTVLCGHLADGSAFKDYYANTHTPIAMKMPDMHKMEITKFIGAPDAG